VGHGIEVRGGAVDIDDISNAPSRDNGAVLVAYRSPPLATLALRLMKMSQNLYAETLLKTMGAAAGMPTAEAGRAATRSVLEGWGVPPSGMIQVDGSGLSRYNFVTPETLVTILTLVDRDERSRAPFEAALPIAGRDGNWEVLKNPELKQTNRELKALSEDLEQQVDERTSNWPPPTPI